MGKLALGTHGCDSPRDGRPMPAGSSPTNAKGKRRRFGSNIAKRFPSTPLQLALIMITCVVQADR